MKAFRPVLKSDDVLNGTPSAIGTPELILFCREGKRNNGSELRLNSDPENL
jgi:hypothetical protein